MACAIGDLGRVFPKKSVLLKTYMLGCFYLFYSTMKPEEKRQGKQTIKVLRPLVMRNQSQRNLFQKNIIHDHQEKIKKPQNTSNGLMEFRKSAFCSQEQNLDNTTFQVHILEINSKTFQHFCLDDLSTIQSECIPDQKFNFKNDSSEVDMTQSCIF